MKKKYKVVWEERHYTIVKANSPDEAEEIVMNGEFDKDFSDEITSELQAFEIS